MFGAAEVRKRKHGYARLQLEVPGEIGRQAGDFCQVLCCWLDDDRGVREQVHLVSDNHDIHTRGTGDAR